LVTSASAGEGKTITAINLAISIASEIDYTVLLVDTDLKRPSIHKYLGIETEYGLSDCLTGKAELSDVMIKTGIGKLVFLPAGNATENAAELLSSERMKMLVNEMKHRYKDRYIIFDSSPLLLTSDAIPLSNYIDGVLLVIQASRTTPKDASLAVSQIKGSNILGVVFNNVPKYLAANLYPYYHLYEKEGYYQKAQDSKEIENNR
jgi:exopolysaccharide/PEP-CTERM locus tyrosine autokinase